MARKQLLEFFERKKQQVIRFLQQAQANQNTVKTDKFLDKFKLR